MFFDTETPRFMWGTQNETVTALRVLDEQLTTRSNIAMGGFGNWQMPAFEDYGNLVQGWSGTPRAWLQSQVQVPLRHQLLWGSGSLRKWFSAPTSSWVMEVTIFDLATGRREQHIYDHPRYDHDCLNPQCSTQQDPALASFLRSKIGGLMLLRYLAPGESYWW
jgi:hypothetical protein